MDKTVWASHSFPPSKARYLMATEKIAEIGSLSALYRHNNADSLAGIILMTGSPACHGTQGTAYPK